MKSLLVICILLLTNTATNAQDLELSVYLLPPAQLGDPAAFNIKILNRGEEPVEGVEAKITIKSGLQFSSIAPSTATYDKETGLWYVGKIEKNQSKTIAVIARYVDKEEALLLAEVIRSSLPDPDSTPGNGVDTNGNGKVIHDRGDEDDGDAAQIRPYSD